MTIWPAVYSIFLLGTVTRAIYERVLRCSLSQKYTSERLSLRERAGSESLVGNILTAVRLVTVSLGSGRWLKSGEGGEVAPGECFSCSDRRGNGIHGESLSYSVRAIVKRPSLLRVEVSRAFNVQKREASLTEGIRGKETRILENVSQEAKHLLRSRTGRSSVTEFCLLRNHRNAKLYRWYRKRASHRVVETLFYSSTFFIFTPFFVLLFFKFISCDLYHKIKDWIPSVIYSVNKYVFLKKTKYATFSLRVYLRLVHLFFIKLPFCKINQFYNIF